MATATKQKEVTEYDELPEGFEVSESGGVSDLPEGFEILEDSSEEAKPVKLDFSEKIADFVSGGMIREGKQFREEAKTGSMGENAQKLAKGGEALESTAKTVGQIGQSIIAVNQTANLLSKVPMLQKQKIIQGLVSSAETRLANRGIRISNVQRAAQRFAIEGAVSVQPFDYKDIEDRIKSTAIASAISPLIGFGLNGATKIAQKISRDISKFKTSLTAEVRETTSGGLRDPRMPAISSIRDSLSKVEKEASEIGQSSRRQIVEAQGRGRYFEAQVEERAKAMRGSISIETKAKEMAEKTSMQVAKNKINESIDRTDNLLRKESDITAKSYQKEVGKFFRENSEIYGKHLDEVSEKIRANGRMTRQEAFDVLQNTVKKSASEASVFDGEIIDEVNKLIQNKYNPATNVTDPTTGTIYRNMDELIPFDEFLGEVRDIWGKVYSGEKRLSHQEIPAAILRSEFGDLVSGLPGGESFQALQSSYRPVISYMNRANSVLQPYKGEAYTKTAEGLVRAYAKGESSEADRLLIEFIENGTEKFAKGVGAYSARAKQLGQNMKTLSSEMRKMGQSSERRMLEIASDGAEKISRVDTASKNAEKIIQNEVDRRSLLILQEAAEEEGRTLARARQLRGREMNVKNLTSRMQKIKSLSTGAVKLLAGLTSGYLVLKGGSEIVGTIGKEE